MKIFMFTLCLLFTGIISDYVPYRTFSVKLSIPSNLETIWGKISTSLKQQQKNMEADRLSQIEEKRHHIYKEYLLSRVRGPVFKDFYNRF